MINVKYEREVNDEELKLLGADDIHMYILFSTDYVTPNNDSDLLLKKTTTVVDKHTMVVDYKEMKNKKKLVL